MRARWGALLIVPLFVSGLLLLGSQYVFLKQSLHVDLAFGTLAPGWSLSNYARLVTDPYYRHTLWLTTYIALIVAGVCMAFGFPIAIVLARLKSRWTTILLGAIVLTSFVTTVVQIFGLIIIFRGDGPVNRLLRWLGMLHHPVELLGSVGGVVVGLVYASFGFAVMLMYGVTRTIPVSLDEAAAVHGASPLRVFARVILPLSLPGLVVGFLTIFNLSMGAFTSAALLGGGRIITLPVLIQRTMLLDVKYGMAGALAAALLLFVVTLNLVSVTLLRRFRAARMVLA